MFDMLRESPRKSLIVLLLPALVAAVYFGATIAHILQENDGNLGAVLDDTWIHIRFADNIANGDGLSYNEGVLTTGATSPLWVLMLAGVYAVFDPPVMEQINHAMVFSAVWGVIAVIATTGLGWWLSRKAWVGVLAGLIVALTGRMVWMGLSGMETSAFAAFCVLALWSHADDLREGRAFGWRTGILTALATLARPEGYALALLIGGSAFVVAPLLRWRADWLARVRGGWRGIVAYVLLAGSYPLVSLLISGYPLPNTFRSKSELGREFPELPRTFFWQPQVDFGLIVLLLMCAGFVLLMWRWWRGENTRLNIALITWSPLFVLAVLFMGVDRYVVNNSRYVAPAIPFYALFAAVIVAWIGERFSTNSRTQSAISGGIGAVVLVLVLSTGIGQAGQVANDVYQLRAMHVTAAQWFDEVTAPDATIALNDVGAMVHLTDRDVMDLEGLVSQDVIDAIDGTTRFSCDRDLELMRLMLTRTPAFIGVFPWFYPCMTGWEGALQPYNVFSITGPTVIAGGELVVYQPVWEQWPLRQALPDDVNRLDAAFEQGIALAGYTLAQVDTGLQVTLWWSVDAVPDQDYNVFVHLIDADGEIIAQGDSPPQDGRFPTSLWREGDLIPDPHLIPVESTDGAAAIRIGFYVLDGSRPPLRRVDAEGDSVLLPLVP